MNKAELIDAMAEQADLSKVAIGKGLDALMKAIQAGLVKGEEVALVGFGRFEVRERAARKGLNPQTKTAINIPAAKVPVFKAGKTLKSAVN